MLMILYRIAYWASSEIYCYIKLAFMAIIDLLARILFKIQQTYGSI